MRILGLTGSIAMGKSTAARLLRGYGIWVHDADAAVHRLTGPGGKAMPSIAEAFPDCVRNGQLDRAAMGARAFREPGVLDRLEGILHPLVRQQTRRFLLRAARAGQGLVVLDVPLLYDKGLDRTVDAVLVVSAPERLQRLRVLSRPGMTDERFGAILARQMPDREKRRRAEHVIPTGLGLAPTDRALKRALKRERRQPGRKWRPACYPYQSGQESRSCVRLSSIPKPPV